VPSGLRVADGEADAEAEGEADAEAEADALGEALGLVSGLEVGLAEPVEGPADGLAVACGEPTATWVAGGVPEPQAASTATVDKLSTSANARDCPITRPRTPKLLIRHLE
jgi:hypothetical protein